MSVTVTVRSASSLPNVEKFGLSDPYAILTFQGESSSAVVATSERHHRYSTIYGDR